jgi:hypothetical protein
MTDNEVLNYFKNNTGKVCGRFANDQLQRPFVPAKEQKKKTRWLAMMMPFMLLNKQDSKNKNVVKQKVVANDSIPSESITVGMILLPISKSVESDTTIQECTASMGDVAIEIPDTSKIIGDAKIEKETARIIGDTIIFTSQIINGRVVDEKGNGIAFATISGKESFYSVYADSAGSFQLEISNLQNSPVTVSAIGYESKEILMNDSTRNDFTIVLKQKEIFLPKVTVAASESYLGGMIAGSISVCVIKKHSIVDTVQKIFKTQLFKLYPNPAPKGSLVHLQIKKTGKYSIQLFDNSSRLILVQDFSAINNNAITNISIPSSLAAGVYYVRVIDEEKKKQYVDKILVE